MSNEVYTNQELRDRLTPVFRRYGVRKAILFGSYSKGNADAKSDVDLLVDSGLRGLRFVGLIEDVQEALDKDVDVIDVSHVEKGSAVAIEIEQTGRAIYEK